MLQTWHGLGRGVLSTLPWSALSVLVLSSSAQADFVRITSVNGNYDPDHSEVTYVRPGDVISLSADTFSDDFDGQGSNAQNRDIENFLWQTDTADAQICDASLEQQCLDHSDFEVTDYGVNYYVPYDAPSRISITVYDRNTQQSDVVFLENAAQTESNGSYIPLTTVITDPDQYNYNDLRPDYALAGMGRWVYVNGSRYWVPYTSQDGWIPYQNGYWNDSDDGLVWVSYDPWGWYTDHYGVWRNHHVYGWIWLPFATPTYRPHTATFYYGDDYIGWYPYYDGYRDGYRHGYDDGFRDGYWDGYYAGSYYGSMNSYYRPGFTVVRYGHFHHYNMYDYRVDVTITYSYWGSSYGRGYYGPYPGGYDWYSSRVWLNGRLVSPLPYSRVVQRPCGNTYIRYPVRTQPLPPYYRDVAYGPVRGARPIPVGSQVRPPVTLNGRPVVVPPTAGNRGVTTPPRYYDQSRGQHVPLPPRTTRPTQPNPQNPNARPMPPASQPGGQPGTRPAPPAYRPGQPGGTNPGGQPGRPRPAPQPGHPGNQPGGPRPVPPVTRPQPGPGNGNGPGARPAPAPTTRPAPAPTTRPAPAPTTRPAPAPTTRPAPAPTARPAPQPRPPSGGGGGTTRPTPPSGGGGGSRPTPPSGGGSRPRPPRG